MKAVFRHELASHFTGMSGYVFGAFLLLFGGIYTMVYNLKNALTNFEYVLGNMSFVYLVIIPILTMRVLAEERRQKTDQLLYSLPLSMGKVVLGKYAAMLVMLAVPCGILCIYPLVLKQFGNLYLPASYSAIIGFFLLGAALVAIGMFVSSLTESQAVAAGLCFVVVLINYYLSSLASYVSSTASGSLTALAVVVLAVALVVRLMTRSTAAALGAAAVGEGALFAVYAYDSTLFEGLFPTIIENLSLFERFYIFVDGLFDLTGVVYFLSVVGLFLFLTVQSMEKRRWSE